MSGLLVVSLLPIRLELAGTLYFFVALFLGVLFVATTVWFALRQNDRSAHGLFLTSVVYLPLLLTFVFVGS